MRHVHRLFILTGLLTLALCLPASAQTNQFYRAQGLDVGAGPSITLGLGKPQYGVAVESRYWESAYTATAIQIGNSDLGPNAYPGITYSDIKQYVRIIPFGSHPFLGRFALGPFTGVKRFFNDGATAAPVGGFIDFALTRKVGLEFSLEQDIATSPRDDGLFGVFEIQYKL